MSAAGLQARFGESRSKAKRLHDPRQPPPPNLQLRLGAGSAGRPMS